MGREDVSSRCNAIEECYEFLLAYAGQGLSGKENSQSSSQVRDFLNRAVEALTGLADAYARTVREENLQPGTLRRISGGAGKRRSRFAGHDSTGSRPTHH